MKVRNWGKFQHYKKSKGRAGQPNWIKVYKTLLDDQQFAQIEGDAARVLIWCWLVASENNGELPPLSNLSFRFRIPEKRLAQLITQLNHWLEDDASSPLADCYQAASLEEKRIEEKRYIVRSDDRTPEKRTSDKEEHEAFDRFWKAYPKRKGSNPRFPASLKFKAAVLAGTSADQIVGAAAAYADEQRKLEKVGTEFIALATTWLNQRRYLDYQPQQSQGPPAGLDAEQRAAWVREQMRKANGEEKRGTDERGDNQERTVLEGRPALRQVKLG
jgi:hypothetical protein